MSLENHQDLNLSNHSFPKNAAEERQQPEEKEKIISLLEERLLIDRTKRKVGEIVVRKKVETRMVQVPVKWEKLIIEEVGSETKQLAEINLGQGEIAGIELKQLAAISEGNSHTVSGEFFSMKAARDILDAIALHSKNSSHKVRIELMVEDPQQQELYQKMFDRAAGKTQKSS
jgi:diaminopimelate epimerase